MGCYESRELEDQEKIISRAEAIIGLNMHKSIDIDRVTHRFSSKKLMNKTQLEAASKVLNIHIDDSRVVDFLLLFYNPKKYSYCVRKLSVLGVLLGKGQDIEKIKVLFDNYDLDTSGKLSKTEIIEMLNDLCTIAHDFLPSFALTFAKDSEREIIESYRKELHTVRNTLINYYMNLLFRNDSTNTEMSLNAFQVKFSDPRLRCILKSYSLRKSAKSILSTVQSTASMVREMMDNPEILAGAIEKLNSPRGDEKFTFTEAPSNY